MGGGAPMGGGSGRVAGGGGHGAGGVAGGMGAGKGPGKGFGGAGGGKFDKGPKPAVNDRGRTDWGKVAQWYDTLVGDEGSEFHREVVLPGTLRLLGGLGGKKVLDVACGQGVMCRVLAERGAEVTGVDAAVDLIAAAKTRGPESIRYVVDDATKLQHVPAEAFDAATCLLAIQNMNPPGAVFSAAARALKPGGVLVVVMMHPAFRSPKATQWGWVPGETAAGVQFRRVDKYLVPRKEPIVAHPGKAAAGLGSEYTWSFHHPIGAYVGFARKAGLLTDAMEEWASHKKSDSGPKAPAENVARAEIPMFLALRCVKVPAVTPTATAPVASPDVAPDATPSDE